jgi:hypothetical protein
VAEGSKKLEIAHVMYPSYWQQFDSSIIDKRSRGYKEIEQMTRDTRLVIKDTTDGSSLSYGEACVKYFKDRYPDRNIVYILDNFHDLDEFSGFNDDDGGWFMYRIASSRLKRLATLEHIAVLCTVEYTKLQPGVRPNNHNIAGSVAMSYDSNVVMHVYNDVHDMGERAQTYHTEEVNGKEVIMPTIELAFGKNKVSAFKGKLHLDFYPASSDFVCKDTDPTHQNVSKEDPIVSMWIKKPEQKFVKKQSVKDDTYHIIEEELKLAAKHIEKL